MSTENTFNDGEETPLSIAEIFAKNNDNSDPEDKNTGENAGENSENGDEVPFWQLLQERTSIEVDVADLEDTFEGAVKREERVYEAGKTRALAELESKHPDIFQLLKYKENGGDIFTLLEQQKGRENASVSDEADAARLISQYLTSRGLPAEDVEEQLSLLKDKGTEKLMERAKHYGTLLDEEYRAKYALEIQRQEAQAKFLEQDYADKSRVLSEIIDKGVIEDFAIPQKDREAFKSFVKEHLEQAIDGKYYIIKEVDFTTENITKTLKNEFFTFKKGNLTEIVKAEANNTMLERLKKSAKGTGQKPEEKVSSFDALFNK